jgi:hypothetical protein
MQLESLSKSLFVPMHMDEAANVLGGMIAVDAGGGTFHNCYTFLNDGSYTSDDKDQDSAS